MLLLHNLLNEYNNDKNQWTTGRSGPFLDNFNQNMLSNRPHKRMCLLNLNNYLHEYKNSQKSIKKHVISANFNVIFIKKYRWAYWIGSTIDPPLTKNALKWKVFDWFFVSFLFSFRFLCTSSILYFKVADFVIRSLSTWILIKITKIVAEMSGFSLVFGSFMYSFSTAVKLPVAVKTG